MQRGPDNMKTGSSSPLQDQAQTGQQVYEIITRSVVRIFAVSAYHDIKIQVSYQMHVISFPITFCM